ncbi:sigma-70 family RNA polymerase sigma factor [Paenibacillus sp. Root444D2]|uniref:sigma-70 family RNA polymerase sigma factor n=1 Tax=Paenibacillus sp. Root444D2 TaxID=1736538 RepID=UPI00070994F2|nr:sigma-70 family RNA polymerase sigma factor [Paenibacillus sp. Root444D2]KQX51291.1 RNA polymerase subunit sigma-70 [Paenibacillus sp. Root444D2]
MSEKHGELDMAEELRSELIGYCYRMMGSIFDAEDAVQDTMLRVWQSWDQIRQDSSRKSWIYRIATNVCLDKLRHAKRRALPMDLSDPATIIVEPRDNLPRTAWIWPAPDTAGDPADIAVSRETIRLSFIAILQTLPPRQRAVFILHDVFRWPAKQTADAMGMTVAAVNSTMQRARVTLTQANLRSDALREMDVDADQRLLACYVEAFEQYNIEKLLALFHESGSLSMPPFVMWVCGKMKMASFYQTTRNHCTGSRLVSVRANGNCPAYAQYVQAGRAGVLVPWGIHILEIQNGKIAHIHHFIDTDLFAQFGLPTYLDASMDFTANR